MATPRLSPRPLVLRRINEPSREYGQCLALAYDCLLRLSPAQTLPATSAVADPQTRLPAAPVPPPVLACDPS